MIRSDGAEKNFENQNGREKRLGESEKSENSSKRETSGNSDK